MGLMKKLISLCGSDGDDESLSSHALEVAEKVGRLIAQNDGVLVCGGHSGVMKVACKGCKEEGGTTVGIMPYTKEEANKYIDIAIPTGIGNIRNYLVSSTGDVAIAIGGRWGTLNEIALIEIALILLIIIGAFVGGFVYSVLKDILKELKGVKSLVLHTMSDVMEISIDVEEIKSTPKDILDFIKTERIRTKP